MKPSELRIGNIVERYTDGKSKMIKKIGRIGYFDTDLYWLDKPMTQQLVPRKTKWDDIRPIPITEDWLLKLGFDNTQRGFFKIRILNRGSINVLISKKRLLVELGTTGGYLFGNTDIKHIHQLQNLYFSLTGEELTKVKA